MRAFFLHRPKKPPIHDSKELLNQIERKDTAFRLAQVVFFIVVTVLLALLVSYSYRLQSQNHALLNNQTKLVEQNTALTKELQASVTTLENNDNAKLADLQSHIDCIVNLFTQPNRANLSITNIQGCQLSVTSSGGASGSTKSAITPNHQPTTTQPHQDSSNGNNNGNGNGNPQPKPPSHPLVCKITLGRIGCK